MAPPPAAFRSGTARRAQRNWPVRSISMQRRHSAGSISSTAPVGPAIPALFTSTSSPPSDRPASSNRRSTCASSDTSARLVPTGNARPQASSALASTSQVARGRRRPTSASTIARPIPAAPAVTITRCPLASNSAMATSPFRQALLSRSASTAPSTTRPKMISRVAAGQRGAGEQCRSAVSSSTPPSIPR